MDILFSNPHNWVILGLVLILIETFIIPGIGFLFAGIAAFVTGSLVILNVIDNSFYSQLTCFLTASVLSGLLIIPIKKLSKNNSEIKNIVGQKAIICNEKLEYNKLGKVKWSGAIFNARLAVDSTKFKDEEVEIIEIEGNVLKVK